MPSTLWCPRTEVLETVGTERVTGRQCGEEGGELPHSLPSLSGVSTPQGGRRPPQWRLPGSVPQDSIPHLPLKASTCMLWNCL